MPVKIANSFSPTSEVGAALNNAITSYTNSIPTYGEAQKARVDANMADYPTRLKQAILDAQAGTESGGTYTALQHQNSLANRAEALAMGGKIDELGNLGRVMAYSAAKPESTQMLDRSYMGAGGNYANTETGFQTKEANDMEKMAIQQAGADRRTQNLINSKALSPTDPLAGLTPVQRLKAKEQIAAKQQLNAKLDELESLYKALEDEGAAVSTNSDFLTNKTNQLASTGIGQAMNQGGRSQSIRNQIEAIRQSLRIGIMAASGLGSKVFDSNKDLEAMLRTVTSPGQDVEANRGIIRNLRGDYASPMAGAAAGLQDTASPAASGGTDVLGLFGGSEDPSGGFTETLQDTGAPAANGGFKIRKIR